MHTNIAKIKTNIGDIELMLYGNHAPNTVKNFIELNSKKFYDNLIFHRVISDFMIQGGDPNGDGRGGPGYTFDDEIHGDLNFNKPYLLAMANAGKTVNSFGNMSGTNGSQFFITVNEANWLNGKHTIFGQVIKDKSIETVIKISKVKCNNKNKPLMDIIIEKIQIQ